MKGTMTIRGATVDLKNTQLAKIQDIETLHDQLSRQDEILDRQPTRDHLAGLYTLAMKQDALIKALLAGQDDILTKLNETKPSLWARIKTWFRR